MPRRIERIAGRLLTGPIAFFIAGVVDIAAFVLLAWRERVRRRWGSARSKVGGQRP